MRPKSAWGFRKKRGRDHSKRNEMSRKCRIPQWAGDVWKKWPLQLQSGPPLGPKTLRRSAASYSWQ